MEVGDDTLFEVIREYNSDHRQGDDVYSTNARRCKSRMRVRTKEIDHAVKSIVTAKHIKSGGQCNRSCNMYSRRVVATASSFVDVDACIACREATVRANRSRTSS